MEHVQVKAKSRTVVGKGYARKIRALGYLPAVLYGGTEGAVPLVVDPKVISGILKSHTGRNTVVRLQVEGDSAGECIAIVRDFTVHPVKRTLEHCDFLRVNDQTELLVKVPIKTIGKAEGEKLGARLNIAMRQVTLKCKAGAVPDAIVIDVTPFQVGQSMSLSQLPLPEGVRAVFIKDNAVVTVKIPRAEKEEETKVAEGAAATEAAAPAAGAAAPAAAGAAPAAAKPEKK
jgi:large subunit ribosomal protein L25